MANVPLGSDHTEKTFDNSYFAGGEASYSDYLAEGELLRNRGRWYAQKLKAYAEPGTMLDVGSAAGFILQGFQDGGWTGWGLEPNARQAQYARDQFNLRVTTASLEDYKVEQTFELVSMVQVVAHFVDMRRSLEVTAAATHVGSLLLVETWNWQSLTARAFGKHWHEYSPPSVLRWFTPGTFEKLSGKFGFHKVAQGRPSKSIAGSHAKSLLAYKLRELPLGSALSALTNLIPDGLQIPYPADDLFWMLLKRV